MDNIHRLIGKRTDEIVKPGVNLWSRALVYNHPTQEKKDGERELLL